MLCEPAKILARSSPRPVSLPRCGKPEGKILANVRDRSTTGKAALRSLLGWNGHQIAAAK